MNDRFLPPDGDTRNRSGDAASAGPNVSLAAHDTPVETQLPYSVRLASDCTSRAGDFSRSGDWVTEVIYRDGVKVDLYSVNLNGEFRDMGIVVTSTSRGFPESGSSVSVIEIIVLSHECLPVRISWSSGFEDSSGSYTSGAVLSRTSVTVKSGSSARSVLVTTRHGRV